MSRLKMGMIGGGIGSFIGDVHRKAASIDGMIDLVCGAFSSSEEKSIASAKELGISEQRAYGSYEQMIIEETKLPKEERMDFVAIVTPNHVHFPPAKMALENGFHVICDKPMTLTLDEAIALEKLVQSSGKIFALTHNYTGYPMVKQARAMIAKGDLGAIRKIQVHYLQGWLSTSIEKTGQKQASWRVDPKKSGIGGALGDIATHAENLTEYITGIQIEEIAADLSAFGEDRTLDDDGNILLRFENGAKGTMSFSQIATGEENSLGIRVYGTKGSIEWHQENPNELIAKWLENPKQVFTPSGNGGYPEANQYTRIPAGHPEGYLEGFATIYRSFAKELTTFKEKNAPSPLLDFPTVKDGVRGMRFIYAAVESNNNNAKWVKL
ncbi:Gfo/Idh/MocA family oxidoreductase [Aquimarina sp. 2201CG5-10]|uniref:Gfo/Idh/MocA family protein n=1 Tax=Aquimarina callyspongiae TaxID=3098150 RepID=UPI002AB4F45D|nr:Gfo/Idh/MocA family oxidoreductase [Aquimarina sp. 2201CG5-10]MDY8138003.1 Gfo/Idh/MocA family oxidoreductase [Aquimarina sp. 2201CG5-10]